MDGPVIAGVDGCRAGWVVALAEEWPPQAPPRLVICPDFNSVLALTATCAAVAVDMPIGLPFGSEHRRCDELGRQLLGLNGASRLFYAPPRPTLSAASPKAFQDAHRAICGKGAGLPVWGILPKLREVDAAMSPGLQERVYEFHPEMAWARMAGAVLKSKHTQAGLAQRLACLGDSVPNLDGITAARPSLRRQNASLDDLLDALAGLPVAAAIASSSQSNRRIPAGDPDYDAKGLRMEIWS